MTNRLSSLSTFGRVLFLIFFVVTLSSCLASADKLAVFTKTVLNKKQVDALTGHYGLVGEQGNVSSLVFAPRTDNWSYRSGERTLELASADFTMKTLTIFDTGGSLILVMAGVAVFSKIPGTDLILGEHSGGNASHQRRRWKHDARERAEFHDEMSFLF